MTMLQLKSLIDVVFSILPRDYVGVNDITFSGLWHFYITFVVTELVSFKMYLSFF